MVSDIRPISNRVIDATPGTMDIDRCGDNHHEQLEITRRVGC